MTTDRSAATRFFRKWSQRWHGLAGAYHLWAFKRHCRHLPSWFIEEVFDAEPVG